MVYTCIETVHVHFTQIKERATAAPGYLCLLHRALFLLKRPIGFMAELLQTVYNGK